jgi:hypothetical protein
MRFPLLALVGLFCLGLKVSAMGLPTSEVALVGRFVQGPVNLPLEVDATEFRAQFGSSAPEDFPAEEQALQFFRNGGDALFVVRIDPQKPLGEGLKGSLDLPRLGGLGALLPLSDLGLLLCPELTSLTGPELSDCMDQLEILGEDRPLFTLLDPPPSVSTAAEMLSWRISQLPGDFVNAAVYYPKLQVDPATWTGGFSAERLTIGASGTVAAVIQKNDASRGIWKAPAGTTATIICEGLSEDLSNAEIDELNPAGINALRDLPTFGRIIWGGRTLDSGPENRYLPVARTRRWIVRSLQRDLADAALSSNGTALWANLESRGETFLNSLFREGAAPSEAYFVKCDSETTTAGDVASHRVNVIIGCAFLRSAEFVVDQITLGARDDSRTDPVIPVLVSRQVGGVMHLSFPTVPGFVHHFQTSGSLKDGSWFDGSEIAGDGSWVSLKYPLSSPELFFRVRTSRGW